jgi:hypothetical protein
MAELRRQRGDNAETPNNLTATRVDCLEVDEDNENDAYTAPRTRSVSRPALQQAPIVPMMPFMFGAGMHGFEDEYGDSYTAPRSRSFSRAASQQAQMAPEMFDPGVPDYGFSLDVQNHTASLEWQNYQTFTSTTENNEPQEPPAKRSNTRKLVHYSENTEDDPIENYNVTAQKRRPAFIAASRKASTGNNNSNNNNNNNSRPSQPNSVDFQHFLQG